MNFNTLLKSFWFWTLLTFIGIQFISMDISAKLQSNSNEEIQAPKEVMSILKRSCYDCHSSDVKEPFYYNLAPMSWLVQLHIKNGRKVVNFSKWNSYSKEKHFKVIDKLPKSIIIRMPMPSYLWLHKEATLSSDDRKVLDGWARGMREKVN